MFTRKKLIIGGALAAVAALLLGGAAFYYMMVPHDTPAEATLSSAVASLNSTQSATATSTATDMAGTWVLASDGESFVGYRVQEQLATVGTFTAVGRTSNITASLEYDGNAITGVQVSADLSTLQSDNSMRDGQLKRQALETNTYPTATFTLTQPIQVSAPAEGQTISATAVGDLTLHGVTRSVSIPLQGQLTNGRVVVVGSLDIAFADFGIQKPSSAIVLGVDDHGLLELQLVLQKGSQS